MIQTRPFGTTPDGKLCNIYRISNKKGEYVELINVGASIHAICTADRDGNINDVTLGVPSVNDLYGFSMEGSCIGRCANRIKFGRYSCNGKTVQLECNQNGHFLHGASGNYAQKFFDAEYEPDGDSVSFTYTDTGEGGFDCNVDVGITYTFDDRSDLSIHYDMFPYGDTILCPVNHTYFNLSGGDIRDLELQIMTDEIVSRDEYGIPDGGSLKVYGTPADFTEPVTVRTRMDSDDGSYFTRETRYDEFYLLHNEGFARAASLYCPENGRFMEVSTDMPCLILFNAITDGPVPGKDRASYEGYCGICLETQFVPNAVNCPEFRSPLFEKGHPLSSTTVYSFSAE